MSILNKIAAKIVDSQEDPNKVPLDQMNFRQRATHYTGQMVGTGMGKMLPDSVLHMLGDAIRNEKAAREEQRIQNQKQEQAEKSKEERDKKVDNRITGTNQRLDDLIKINKKLLKIVEDGSGGGIFGGSGASGGAAAAAGAVGIWGAIKALGKNVLLAPGALGMAARGGVAYGADAASGLFGVGSKPIDTKRDDVNWSKMSLLNKMESSMGRAVEHVGDWLMPNVANEARSSRIESESAYIDAKESEKQRQLMRQRAGRSRFNDMDGMRRSIEDQSNERSDRRMGWAENSMLPVDSNRAFSFAGMPSVAVSTSAPASVPSTTARNTTPDLSNLPIPLTGAVTLGSNKSTLIQAIEQQTSHRQQNAGGRSQEIRLDADNIYIGSKNGGQVIKFESPSITYEADKIEFKLRNGEAVPGSSAMAGRQSSSAMPGAPGNDTPPAMMQALQQMGYNPGGMSTGTNGRGQPSGSQHPYDPNNEQPAAGSPGGKVDRSAFSEELKDPNVRARLMALTQTEVGSQGASAQQKFMETVFNRAAMNGKSLTSIMSPSYYPSLGNVGRLSDDQQKHYGSLLSKVHGGSDLSEGATDNASDEPGNTVASNALRRGHIGKWDKGELFYRKREQAGKWSEWRSKTYTPPDKDQAQDPNQTSPSDKFSWGKVDKSKVNPDLAAAAQAAAGYLPQGYSVQATSGFRAGDSRLHGKHMAADFQITGPNGEVIPNAGKDNTGTYKQYAQHMYGWMQQNNPNAASQLAWGGSFPIPYGRRLGQADLMHFDMGGQRGRWTQYQPQNMGGMHGVDYSQPAPTAYAKAPKPEQNPNERIQAAAALSKQQSTPGTPPPAPPQRSDPMSEELGKIGYVGTQPSGDINNSPSSDPGRVGIARDYFERLFGDSPSGWS